MKKLIKAFLLSPESFLKLLESNEFKQHKISKMLHPETKNNLLHDILGAQEVKLEIIESFFSKSETRFTSVITAEMVNSINAFGHNPIYIAANRGLLAATIFLLEMKADPNVCMKDGVSPLMTAAARGHYRVIGTLLSNGADRYLKSNKGFTALHLAARHNKLLAINSLILMAPEIINDQDHDGGTALHLSAGEDEQGTSVKLLIDKKAEVNSRNHGGMTPLMFAAIFNKIEAARVLLDAKAGPYLLCHESRSAMGYAIVFGHIKFLNFLITAKVIKKDFISSLVQNEESPVYTAVRNDRTEILQFLLTANPKLVNFQDKLGETGLHVATRKNPAVTALLLEYEADPNIKNTKGATPLMMACRLGHEQIVERILTTSKIKCDLTISHDLGQTAFYYAACKGNVFIGECLLKAGDLSAGKFILSENKSVIFYEKKIQKPGYVAKSKTKNPEPDLTVRLGDTAFHTAVRNNHVEFVKLLLKYKAVSPDLFSKTKYTALGFSVYDGYEAMALALIENKADINCNLVDDFHILHIAIIKKRTTLLSKILDEKNIELNVCTNLLGSPLYLAVELNNEEAVALLISKKADLNLGFKGATPLGFATEKGRDRVVKLLLDAKADHTKTCTANGLLPLHVILNKIAFPNSIKVISKIAFPEATGPNNWRILKDLIQLNPNMPIRSDGSTALHVSVYANKPLLVQNLLEYSVDVNAQTRVEKITPLHIAIKRGYTQIVELLVQWKANLNVQLSSTDQTPLHFAVDFNSFAIVALLVKNKADLNIRDGKGNTAFLMAQEKKHTAIEELLLSSLNLTSPEESENKKEPKKKVKTQSEPYKPKKQVTKTHFFQPPPVEGFDFGEYGRYDKIKSDEQKIGIRRLMNHDGLNTNWFIKVTNNALDKIVAADPKISKAVLSNLRQPLLVQRYTEHQKTGFLQGNERLGKKDIYLKLTLSKLSELRLFSTEMVEKEGKILFILDHFKKLHGRTTGKFDLIKNQFVLARSAGPSIAERIKKLIPRTEEEKSWIFE